MKEQKIWHRRDITTSMTIKAAIESHEYMNTKGVVGAKCTFKLLKEWTGAPDRVIELAIERDAEQYYLEYGVSLGTAWATPKGKEYLEENPI